MGERGGEGERERERGGRERERERGVALSLITSSYIIHLHLCLKRIFVQNSLHYDSMAIKS